MRVKIQKSMLLVLCITLLTTFSLLIAATYFQSLNNMKAELKQEAVYIQTAINISGTKYLEDMDAAQVLFYMIQKKMILHLKITKSEKKSRMHLRTVGGKI